MQKRKVIIVEQRAHKFESRLWNGLSVYAFALESGASFYDFSFFERIPLLGRIYTGLAVRLLNRKVRQTSGITALNSPKVLPLSPHTDTFFENYPTRYFFGWMFSNPAGLSKYRKELLAKFGPTASQTAKIDTTLTPLAGRTLIGVELKLLPYQGFQGGDFIIKPKQVAKILAEYLRQNNLEATHVGLVIVADTAFNTEPFNEYAKVVSTESAKINLFLLARCSVVIGTNSRFANLAAWFGNMPHVVTTGEPVDWEYYRGKDTYFENKYATYALGLPVR